MFLSVKPMRIFLKKRLKNIISDKNEQIDLLIVTMIKLKLISVSILFISVQFRQALTAIYRELFIDAQHSQGIAKVREYLTPQEYKRAKMQQEEQISEKLQPLKDELKEY